MKKQKNPEFIAAVLNAGYEKIEYGYRKIIQASHDNTIIQWITLFEDQQVQFFAYYEGDDDSDNYVYNTQIINVTTDELKTLINIFKNTHEITQ